MELTLLGTSCSLPTKERNTAGYFLEYKNQGILFDCGEGTQRQMKIAGLKLSKITKILLTHWHGDHCLGLAGILQSIGQLEFCDTLELYGPLGSKEYYYHLTKSLAYNLEIPVKIIEVEGGIIFENEDFLIEALPMRHRVRCLAYNVTEKPKRRMKTAVLEKLGLKGPIVGKLQRGESITHKGKTVTPDDVSVIEHGRKVTYITDTLPNENALAIARDADILLCEAVFEKKLAAKAQKVKHLTVTQTAQIASQAGVKKLILTHYSARYKDSSSLLEEARGIFDNTFAGKDLMRVKV